jgi:hypothetical protein
MCFFTPKIPPIPEARPLAPMAEKTAEGPVLSDKRTTQKPKTPNTKPPKRGISSLRIPMRGRGI